MSKLHVKTGDTVILLTGDRKDRRKTGKVLEVSPKEGKVIVEGINKPTQESTLHGNLYRRYSKIGGIVHTHSPFAIMVSLVASELPLVTMHSSLKLKNPIKVVDVTTQAVTKEELPKVFSVLDAASSVSHSIRITCSGDFGFSPL